MGHRYRRTLVGLAVVAACSWPAPTALASLDGPCDATINGNDVEPLSASDPGDAIEVSESDTIEIDVESSESIRSYRIELEYAGTRWTVASGDADDDGWSREVEIDDYARFGAGLYRVRAVSEGSEPCTGSVLIDVDGQPLTTPVGLVAAAFALAGVANGVLSLRSGRRRVRR